MTTTKLLEDLNDYILTMPDHYMRRAVGQLLIRSRDEIRKLQTTNEVVTTNEPTTSPTDEDAQT